MQTIKVKLSSKRIKKDTSNQSKFEKIIDPNLSNSEIKMDTDDAQNYSEYYLDDYCIQNQGKKQIYAKDGTKNDFYHYSTSKNRQVYAWDTQEVEGEDKKVEYPAVKDGKQFYARKLDDLTNDEIEYPPIGSNEKPNWIYSNDGHPVYPKNLSTNQVILPIDPVTGLRTYIDSEDHTKNYIQDELGTTKYGKDELGNDILINERGYARNTEGEYYPKRHTGDEYYMKRTVNGTKKDIAACKTENGKLVPYYAKTVNRDEFYPREYFIEVED